jgi:hypothetical protein
MDVNESAKNFNVEIYYEYSVHIERTAKEPRPGSCCASTGSAYSMMSHQCCRPTKVKRLVQKYEFHGKDNKTQPVEREYCGIHDPKRLSEKRAKFKVIQDTKAVRHKEARVAFEQACVVAIEQIAAGHNDAMTLAREVMKGKPEHE